jgi:Undecaprenyl-phosphate glucose phosphotransferase
MEHFFLLLYFNITWIVLFTFQGIYKIYRVSKVKQVIGTIYRQIFLHFLLVESFVGITGAYEEFQVLISLVFIQLALLLPVLRFLSIKILRLYRHGGNNVRKVVIAGTGVHAQKLGAFFEDHLEFGYRLQAYFSNSKNYEENSFQDLNKLIPFVIANKIDVIYCSMHELGEQELTRLIEFANKNLIRIKLLPGNKGYNKNKYKLDYYGDIPVLIPKVLALDNLGKSLLKRIFDILFSSIVIVGVLSWVIPILAILIRLDSKGSIIFKQKRSGFNNQDFNCFKLRTMYVNQHVGMYLQATKGDPRVTKIGSFLRRTSLDELPQFFNVFLGNMSLIGPRPHPVEMTEQYDTIIDNYMLRHAVKPGISGMSQVFGYRGETKELSQMRNRVKMDVFYIEKWSIWLDIKIVLWTIKSILGGQEEAY